MSRQVDHRPIEELLRTVYKIMKTDKEPPDLSAVRHSNVTLKQLSREELRTLVLSLERLVGGFISLQGDIVSIQAPPDRILSEIRHVTDNVPQEFIDIYLKTFQ